MYEYVVHTPTNIGIAGKEPKPPLVDIVWDLRPIIKTFSPYYPGCYATILPVIRGPRLEGSNFRSLRRCPSVGRKERKTFTVANSSRETNTKVFGNNGM